MTTMLRAIEVSAGWHPSERMVILPVEDGTETVFVDQHSLLDGYLLVQDTQTSEDGHRLVELPREAMSGAWRVWVDTADLRHAADT
mgnify:CR=1 FL=1